MPLESIYKPLIYNWNTIFRIANYEEHDKYRQQTFNFYSYPFFYPRRIIKYVQIRNCNIYEMNVMRTWRDNIFFILVEPKEAGNIRTSARALKNMGVFDGRSKHYGVQCKSISKFRRGNNWKEPGYRDYKEVRKAERLNLSFEGGLKRIITTAKKKNSDIVWEIWFP